MSRCKPLTVNELLRCSHGPHDSDEDTHDEGLGDGLTGRLAWVDEDLRRDLALAGDSSQSYSRLQFAGARVWGVEIGATTLPFTTSGRHFRLLDPVFLPIFAGTPKQYVRFDAGLRPISLGLVAPALGLPRFEGTLAGSIPGIEVRGDTVTTSGNLEMNAFDGKVTVRDLRLKDPLGQYPQLSASIDVDRLDLAQLTSTFSFGIKAIRYSGMNFAWKSLGCFQNVRGFGHSVYPYSSSAVYMPTERKKYGRGKDVRELGIMNYEYKIGENGYSRNLQMGQFHGAGAPGEGNAVNEFDSTTYWALSELAMHCALNNQIVVQQKA